MHLPPLIHDLAIILAVAGLVSMLFQKLKQPVVLGYIVAGLIVGPHTPPFNVLTDIEGVKVWAELGVIFLMFSLGLEFSFRKLTKVGLTASVTAFVEVVFMIALGFAAGKILHYSAIDSFFLGAMMSISSTTIIVKALDELKLKTRRFAEVIFAVLVVEDLLAILVLVTLTTVAVNKSLSSMVLLVTIFKLLLVVGGWFLVGYFVVPKFMKTVGRIGTNEMLTVISMGLCLILVVFAAYFQYSVALGAFIMGSILAESKESHRIHERIEPLRDVFAAVFFVSIGMLLNPRLLWENLGAVAFISIITIFGKIFSTTLGCLLTGQNLRKSVQVGFGLAQIGEFSFIIATLGSALNVTGEFLYPIGVAVSVVTTFTTPYLIRASSPCVDYLEANLPEKVKFALSRYIIWVQARKTEGNKNEVFYGQIFRWLLNGLVVSIIFISSSGFFMPLLRNKFNIQFLTPAFSWILTVGVSSPFIWAMLSIFNTEENRMSRPGKFTRRLLRPTSLIIFRALSLFWIGALGTSFFPVKYVLSITGIIVIVLFGLFYRRIESSYRWFERNFLSTFEASDPSEEEDVLKGLAPWDTRLVRIKVAPGAELGMKTLANSEIRTRYGVNVIAIQRGHRVIGAPKPNELILPQDELLVLGTDDHVEAVRSKLEKSDFKDESSVVFEDFLMKQFMISEKSSLVGKTLRGSAIREKYNSIVVGIEQDGHRVMNPEPNCKLSPGDILWIVGKKADLSAFKLSS